MSVLGCYRVGTLLSRQPAQLSPGQRLEIEQHRGVCQRCRENASFDDALRAMAAAAKPARPVEVEYAMAGAFARHATPAAPSRLRARRAVAIGGLLVAATAAAALALVLARAPQRALSIAVETPESSEAVEGSLAVGVSRELAHATIAASRPTRYRWRAAAREVELTEGAVRIDVTPGTGRSFVVATPRFTVVVLGTAFDVDLDGVRVHRGVVQVQAAGGEVLVERLTAGEAWRASEPDEPDEPDEILGDVDLEPEEPAREERISASEWLARATRQIRAQRLARARRSIRSALTADPSGRERAEGNILLAEISLVSGNVERAIARYKRVASRFRRYPQGEAALFAAARLEAKRGRAAVARELLTRYQSRYPKGRFAKEVSKKLEALEMR